MIQPDRLTVKAAEALQQAATEAGLKRFEVEVEEGDNGDGPIIHIRGDAPSNINQQVLKSPDYQAMFELFQGLPPFYRGPAIVTQEDGEEAPVGTVEEMISKVFEFAKQGASFQRYKGLGEMNPEQLWETTMNPETRTLLKVTQEDAVASDEMFTVLMGDAVEPRRLFIEKHALDVANLDI